MNALKSQSKKDVNEFENGQHCTEIQDNCLYDEDRVFYEHFKVK